MEQEEQDPRDRVDPAERGLRRISPSDLHAAAPLPGNSPIPRATTTASAAASRRLAFPPPPPEPAPCPDCAGAGYYLLAVPMHDPRFGQLQPCSCPAYTQHRARRQAALLASFQSELGLLADCRLDTFDLARPPATMKPAERTSLAAAHAACVAYLTQPGPDWLYLFGPVGSGKSHLAAAVAWELAARDLAVVYRSVPDLIDLIRAGYRSGDYDARLDAVQAAPVLVLDDLGTESDSASTLLFQIIEYRSKQPTRTLITSNLTLAQIEERIRSRIAGRARIVPVLAPDYRLLRHAAA
jgi:DNA replication protein DnaC